MVEDERNDKTIVGGVTANEVPHCRGKGSFFVQPPPTRCGNRVV